MKALDMDADGWEDLAQDCSCWRQELYCNLHRGEEQLQLASDELRVRCKNSQQAPPANTSSKCSTAAGTVTPALACTATTGAAPVQTDCDFLRRRSMTTHDGWMP